MDADVIRGITFALAGLILVGYGLFVRWRIRVHRARRATEGERRAASATRSADALLGRGTSTEPASGAPESGGLEPSVAAAIAEERAEAADSPPPAARAGTVLEAVQGIALPHDLVPHPDATPRALAADRVALVGSTIPIEVLRQQMTAALETIGYELTWADDAGLARRDATELRVDLFQTPSNAVVEGRPAFPMAPPGSVVVDFWLPAEIS